METGWNAAVFNEIFFVAADDDDAADDETNNLVVEDEPALQIDESWCSDDDGESDKNHEVNELKFAN